MINLRRLFLATVTLIFGAFNVSLAMLRLDRYNDTWETVSIGLIYFVALVICTVAFRKFELPVWVAAVVTAVSIFIPVFSQLSLRNDGIQTYDTWYVTAVALLLSAIAVRGRIYFAIFGGLALCIEVIYIGGLEYLPRSGISGAVILIVACIAVSGGLVRAAKDIEVAKERVFSERTQLEFQELIRAEHERSLNHIRNAALPVLEEIATAKKITKTQKARYSALEETLRDEISGGRLATKKMKRVIAAARARGVDVALLDDGGLELSTQAEIDDLLDLVVSALTGINTGRVTIRTQPEEPWLIRMTASRPRVVTPDLDLKLGER
jgi:hypothetical protein